MALRRLRRAPVALIAAYAVALQALLTAFVPAVSAAAPVAFALCSGNVADGYPVHHETPCYAVCVALGHAAGAPSPPDTIAAIAAPAAVIGFVPVEGWIAPVAILGPQAPRGPPLA